VLTGRTRAAIAVRVRRWPSAVPTFAIGRTTGSSPAMVAIARKFIARRTPVYGYCFLMNRLSPGDIFVLNFVGLPPLISAPSNW